MNEFPKQLRQALAKQQAAQADLTNIDNLKPALEEEARKLADKLAGVPAEALIIPSKGGEHFDPATTRNLQDAAHVRDKLLLLPGVRAKYERSLAAATQEVEDGKNALIKEFTAKAREQLEVLREKLVSDMALTTFGGDAQRTKAGVAAVLENSEAKRWLKFWLSSATHMTADVLAARAEAFLAGERV